MRVKFCLVCPFAPCEDLNRPCYDFGGFSQKLCMFLGQMQHITDSRVVLDLLITRDELHQRTHGMPSCTYSPVLLDAEMFFESVSQREC